MQIFGKLSLIAKDRLTVEHARWFERLLAELNFELRIGEKKGLPYLFRPNVQT